MNTRQRFAITYINKDGMRTLVNANQGRNFYDEREKAEEALEAFRGPNGYIKVYTVAQVATLEVRPVKCYWHGDAVGIWFPEHRFERVTGRSFVCNCYACKKRMLTDTGEFPRYGEGVAQEPVFADLNGEPFKAYYCQECKHARESREIERTVTK